MATSVPNYSPHRHAKQRCLRRDDPRTSAPRRAGCEVHKSGSVRGVLSDEGPYSTPRPHTHETRGGSTEVADVCDGGCSGRDGGDGDDNAGSAGYWRSSAERAVTGAY